jgi:hypothetical protein
MNQLDCHGRVRLSTRRSLQSSRPLYQGGYDSLLPLVSAAMWSIREDVTCGDAGAQNTRAAPEVVSFAPDEGLRSGWSFASSGAAAATFAGEDAAAEAAGVLPRAATAVGSVAGTEAARGATGDFARASPGAGSIAGAETASGDPKDYIALAAGILSIRATVLLPYTAPALVAWPFSLFVPGNCLTLKFAQAVAGQI